MWLYLDSYIGAGSVDDPYRPGMSDHPGWSAIDLRPVGVDDGRCLVSLPEQAASLPTGTVLIGELDTPIPRNRTRAIELRLGLDQDVLLGLTPRQLVRRLLTALGDETGRARWRPLRGTRIILGGEL